MTAVLSKHDIKGLIKQEPPLIEGVISLDEQLQPNGIDLTIREIALFQSSGKIATSNNQRLVSDLAPLVFDGPFKERSLYYLKLENMANRFGPFGERSLRSYQFLASHMKENWTSVYESMKTRGTLLGEYCSTFVFRPIR